MQNSKIMQAAVENDDIVGPDDMTAPIVNIVRHRIGTDGEGVTTLVGFHGCGLTCKFCLNPYALRDASRCRVVSARELYEELRVDDLYFQATGGGVTFGGGEPCLRPDFLLQFRGCCGNRWNITLESSLNVPQENLRRLLPVADAFIIDIKDMNCAVYQEYTGRDNSLVLANLSVIADAGRQDDCRIRVPLIPHHNTDADRASSRRILEELGFRRIEMFNYIIRSTKL